MNGEYLTFALFSEIDQNFICDILGEIPYAKKQVKNIIKFKYGYNAKISINKLKTKSNQFVFDIYIKDKNESISVLSLIQQ